MPATLATVSHITKEVYGPRIVNTLNEEDVLAKRLEKTNRGVVTDHNGKYVSFPLRVRRNHGIGYRRENEKLQRAGQQGYISVRVPLQHGYGRVHLTGQTIDLVNDNHKAFANAMDREMTGLKNDLKKDTNRVMYGDGSGVLATVATNTAGTTLTVVNAQYLEEGMQIDIIDPATDTVAQYDIQILAVDGTTITVSTLLGGSTDALADYILVRTGNYNREPQGLASIVDDTGELFGLDAAVERKWRAFVDDNSGTPRALSEGLMITMCDRVRTAGTGKVSAIFSDLASRRAYFNLLTQQRRYAGESKKFDGGLVGLAFHYGTEIPVVEDVDAPPGSMWFLDESAFTIYRPKDWAWEDRDGSIWKWVTDYDAYEALMKKYWEFGVDIRNAHGVIHDILGG